LRKYVFIALSLLLLLSFTALTYAEEPQIKLGGRIMVRGWYFSNAAFSTQSPNILSPSTNTNAVPGEISGRDPEDVALWTSNISLTVDAKVADNVQGFIELEIAQGENVQSGLYIWGGGPSAFQGYDSKPNADMRLRQAWIQYTGSGLFGVPAGLKVGHQLITLGEKQFLNHERFGDDALIVFVNPTKELSLAAATAKLNEGLYTMPGDDIDAYVLMGTYNVNKDNTIGLYYFYADNDDLGIAFDLTAGDPITGPYTNFNGLSFQDLGGHANGMLAGILSYALEVDVQFGKAQAQPGVADDLKYSGYGVYLKGGFKIPDTPLNLRASFAYGSGDNNLDDTEIDEFQACQGFDSEVAIARFVHYTQIYERTIATAALIQTLGGSGTILAAGQGGVPHRNTGIANTTYFNLGADLAATKDLSLSLDGFLLRASKVGGWEELVGDDVSKSVGWEVDFKGSYKLAKNLNYFVEAGYFSPGSFYENTLLVDDRNSVTQIIHGLNLTF